MDKFEISLLILFFFYLKMIDFIFQLEFLTNFAHLTSLNQNHFLL